MFALLVNTYTSSPTFNTVIFSTVVYAQDLPMLVPSNMMFRTEKRVISFSSICSFHQSSRQLSKPALYSAKCAALRISTGTIISICKSYRSEKARGCVLGLRWSCAPAAQVSRNTACCASNTARRTRHSCRGTAKQGWHALSLLKQLFESRRPFGHKIRRRRESQGEQK